LFLVVGVIERGGGTLYCTVLFFDPDGRLLGKHRKLMPTAFERLVWGCGDGSTLPVLDTAIGKIGAVIGGPASVPRPRHAVEDEPFPVLGVAARSSADAAPAPPTAPNSSASSTRQARPTWTPRRAGLDPHTFTRAEHKSRRVIDKRGHVRR